MGLPTTSLRRATCTRWLVSFLICSPLAVHGGEWHVDKKAEGNQVAFTSKVVALTFTGTTDKIDGFIHWEGDSILRPRTNCILKWT